jgi:hypothetical protein
LRLGFGGEGEHRGAKFCADMQRAGVCALDSLIGAWLADYKLHARRTGDQDSFAPRLECPVKIARHDWVVTAGEQQADAPFKLSDVSVKRAGTLGEHHKHGASLVQYLPAERQGIDAFAVK